MATKRALFVETVTADMVFALPNVTVPTSEAEAKQVRETLGAYHYGGKEMRLFLYNAAVRFPQRTFAFVRTNTVHVREDGKLLGQVTTEYTRRAGGYVIRLANDRISKSLKKRTAVLISDPKAAVTAFAKHFDPKSAQEYYGETYSSASSLWQRQVSVRNGAMSEAKQKVEEAMLEFMWSDEGMEVFVQRAKTKPDPVALELLEKHKGAREAREPYADMGSLLQQQKASIVRVTDSGFIVRPTAEVSSIAEYEATELPPMLSNAYVLKLAPINELIPNIGIRLATDQLMVVHCE